MYKTGVIDGRLDFTDQLNISAIDRGFTLGEGFFETMAIHQGSVPLFSYHWSRIKTSAQLLSIPLPFSENELRNLINKLIKLNQVKHCGLRLSLSAGLTQRELTATSTRPTYTIILFSLPVNTKMTYTAAFVNTRRNEFSTASRIKSMSYLDNILAAREAANKGFDDALLLNTQGYLAEAAIANIFVVIDNIIYTPPISDGALPGVLRSVILNELTKIPVVERRLTQDNVLEAQEVFLTNALRGIRSLEQIDAYKINSVEKAMHLNHALQNLKLKLS